MMTPRTRFQVARNEGISRVVSRMHGPQARFHELHLAFVGKEGDTAPAPWQAVMPATMFLAWQYMPYIVVRCREDMISHGGTEARRHTEMKQSEDGCLTMVGAVPLFRRHSLAPFRTDCSIGTPVWWLAKAPLPIEREAPTATRLRRQSVVQTTKHYKIRLAVCRCSPCAPCLCERTISNKRVENNAGYAHRISTAALAVAASPRRVTLSVMFVVRRRTLLLGQRLCAYRI